MAESTNRNAPSERSGRQFDWLEVFCRGLERVGLPVLACRGCAGEALFVIGEDDEQLEVTIDRDEDRPAYTLSAGLAVRYHGAGELSTDHRQAIAVIARLIEKLGPRIPIDLDSTFIKGRDRYRPHQALSFLYPFCTAERSTSLRGPEISEVLVRVTSRCNQACPFCSAPQKLVGGDPSSAVIERLILEVDGLAPTATVTLTGGEPTLRMDLPDLVRAALSTPGGALTVKVQTNAIRYADPELLARYEPSRRLQFFVSLHGTEAHLYDLCTGTRGFLDKALAGIEHLLGLGHRVVLSVVINRRSARYLLKWIEDVATRFSDHQRIGIHFSIVMCPSHRPEASEWLVDYGRLAPILEEAYQRALDLKLNPEPLLSSTHAAIPACFLSPQYRDRGGTDFIVEPQVAQGGRTGGTTAGWVKPPSCHACRYDTSCVGLPIPYAHRFGVDSIRPIDKE